MNPLICLDNTGDRWEWPGAGVGFTVSGSGFCISVRTEAVVDPSRIVAFLPSSSWLCWFAFAGTFSLP